MDLLLTAAPPAGETSLSQVSMTRLAELAELFEVIRGEVEKDGGTAALGEVDYQAGVVTVVLGGACGSCSLTGATVEDGIERILTQRLDWVTEVRSRVDQQSATPGQRNWRPRTP